MPHYVNYKSNGEIFNSGYVGTESDAELQTAGGSLSVYIGDDAAGKHPNLYKMDVTTTPHTIVAKGAISYSINKTTITANGTDTATISGLPTGTVAYSGADSVAETAGVITFSTDMVGSYDIVLRNRLYLDTTLTIMAV